VSLTRSQTLVSTSGLLIELSEPRRVQPLEHNYVPVNLLNRYVIVNSCPQTKAQSYTSKVRWIH
jgi:hypothetical protein